MDKKIACGYIRVSTDKQQELSPDAQIRELKDFCKRNNIILSNIYQDIGVTGTKINKRDGFQNMIADCRSKDHPYDCIVVWKFSRFARSKEDSTIYKSLLAKDNVEVLSVSEPIPDGLGGQLLESILEIMDEYYITNLSQEVKRGMTQGAIQGRYLSIAPYGYEKPKGVEVPYIVPDQAKMIKFVFDEFQNGAPMSSIAKHINDLGYRTKRGAKWETRNIAYILENPFYYGMIRWNYFDKTSNKPKNEEEWILAAGKHEPIITKEQFDIVKELRKKTINIRVPHKKSSASVRHWLCGVLKCPECGANLSYKSYQDKWFYFYCYKYSHGICSRGKKIKISLLEEKFFDFVKNVNCSDINFIKVPEPEIEQNNIAIKEEIKMANNRLKKAKEAYLSGIDTIDEYRENKYYISKDILKLEKKLVSKPKKKKVIPDFTDLVSTFENLTVEQKSNVVRELFHSIIYDYETDSIVFNLYE